MQSATIPLIILAAVAAMGIVLFQYYYKQRRKGKLRLALSFFRFLALFGIFILLINPKLTKKEIALEKSNLVLLTDDSSSMGQFSNPEFIDSILNVIRGTTGLQNKFNIEQFNFGAELDYSDSTAFNKPRTDISKALKSLRNIYGSQNDVVVLISDGNTTFGEDYGVYGGEQEFTVHSMVIGDTTKYEDLMVDHVNANKYAFLKNEFPLEIFISYNGIKAIQSRASIIIDGEKVFTQTIKLDRDTNAITLNPTIKASSVGLKNIQVRLDALQNEKNRVNNQKNLSIEVIDEKTNIALVTEIVHPDVGALKRAIESNEQRDVTIFDPATDVASFTDIDLFILYQPTTTFLKVYDYIKKANANTFTITGPLTNWDYLNSIQSIVTKENYAQTEEVTPAINEGFSLFDIADIKFEGYPPLQTNLGTVLVNSAHEVLLNQKIKGTGINQPLFVLASNDKSRNAFLFGEHIWKWRSHDYRENQVFEAFDGMMGKVVLYLSSNTKRKRLELDYESLYEGVNSARVRATYYDEAYTFDSNASIIVKLKEEGTGETRELPMLLKGGFYEVDLGNLKAGDYSFTVKVQTKNIAKSGKFKVLEFDVEKQFLSSDHEKLRQLSERTGGGLYYPSQTKELIQSLEEDERFVPIQKSHENVVPLVDFKFLLAVIMAALTIEWIIRKYNGLT